MNKTVFFVFVSILSLGTFANESSDYLNLSKKLASLRSEVDQLNQDVQDVRKKYNTQLRSFSLQSAELDATIRKEEIKKKQFQDKISRIKSELKKNDKSDQDLNPLVTEYINKLNQYIETTLPYKKSEREQNLKTLTSDLNKGEISSYQALARLWSAFEDEQRMSRENQVAKEKIEINGQTYLAEVLKLGNVALFYRLEDGSYGKAIKENNDWNFVEFDKDEQKVAAKKLYEGLKKQIKTAQYAVPNALNL